MRAPLLLLALATLGATLALADEPKPFTWNPRQRPRLTAGSRTFCDYELRDARTMKLGKKADLTAVTSYSQATESYRWTRHVKSVESGEISEAEVHIDRWQRAEDDETDRSLEGKTVQLTREGKKLTSRLDDDEGVSAAARDWLEGELFRRSGRLSRTEMVEDQLLPREPAAITTGSEWTRDAKAVALALLGTTDVDTARSSVRGTLTDVKLVRGVHYGVAKVEAILQVRKLDMAQLRYSDGALVEFTWTYEGSLEPGRREDATRSLRFAITGKSKLGDSLLAETRSERTETVKCGPARK